MKHALIAAAALAATLGLGGAAEAQTPYPMQNFPVRPDPAATAARELLNQSMIARPDTGAAAAANLSCQPPAIPAAGWGALPASSQPC